MKKIVLFGSGTVAEKNLHLGPAFIVDNNPDLRDTQFHGLDILDPSVLSGESEKFDVVVCTTSVGEVKKQLSNYGYTWGNNAQAADELLEKTAIVELEETTFRVLISSGLPSTAESFSGGGIHLVEESGDYPSIKNIYQGNTHGLIRTDTGFAFACQGKGIVLLSDSFEVSAEIPVRKGLRPHGLRRYKDCWAIVCSTGDCIIGVDDNGDEVFSYPLSNKLGQYGSPQHHCNDIEVIGDYAYVSMFSISGNWKRGIYDGGILEIDLLSGASTVINNTLTMPHNITEKKSGLYVLDSFKGRLLGPNLVEIAQLPGFVRGFDTSEDYYFVGESKNRNFSRLDPGRSPVSIDSRITIISKRHGFSRSIQLPRSISEIHSVICLSEDQP